MSDAYHYVVTAPFGVHGVGDVLSAEDGDAAVQAGHRVVRVDEPAPQNPAEPAKE